MKNCDVCGTFNLDENNYCIHCGNKLLMGEVCPNCGSVNENSAEYCSVCSFQLKFIVINDFELFFSDFNRDLLQNAQINDNEYNEILSDIFMRADYIDIHGKSIKNKILNFVSSFTRCLPKSRGYERGYIFLGNGIFYDDRLDDSVQIATIIHEFAHYILFSIIENLLCKIFKVNTSTTIQSFVWYFLTLPEFKIMNEYCAHTVEGRFIPYGYQNYGSFNVLVKDMGLEGEYLDNMIVLGNSFANEIIIYLEKYIDEELRSDIKLQYKRDLATPSFESILRETNDCFPLNIKNKIIIGVLYDIFLESSDESVIRELESIKESIEMD